MARESPIDGLVIRPARPQDRLAVNNLINFETYTHRHMDWQMPVDWIGQPPFLVAERHGRISAVLACPPDPEEVAWVRAFACAPFLDVPGIWRALWQAALDELRAMKTVKYAVSIALDDWYLEMLKAEGFTFETYVILLSWENGLHPLAPSTFSGRIRLMQEADLETIHRIDQAAFEPIWRYSPMAIKLSFDQASIATVAEDDSGILGYQVSTPSPLGGHLARLAVRPGSQQKGVGTALVLDLLRRFKNQGAMRVTVNTQENNEPSKNLYSRAYFRQTGEKYPVFRLKI